MNGKILEMDKTVKRDGEEYKKRSTTLQAQLDKELEWKPSETTGTNMSQPLYDATDWNYVRFNVRGAGCTWTYEMVNGELKTYSC